MGPVRAHGGVLGDPVTPGMDGSVAGDSGARTVAHLVGVGRGAGQDAQRGLSRGARVRAAEGPVDTQGRGQAGGPLASSLS